MRQIIPASLLALTLFTCQQGHAEVDVQPQESAVQTRVDGNYLLGVNDEITVQAPDIEEVSKTYRVDGNGNVNIPVVGRIHVAERTAEQAEGLLRDKLKTYYKSPEVAISISQYQSQPVSLLGAFVKPDIYQVQGRKTLFEMIAIAGGLRADAGSDINILRRREYGTISVPGARPDDAGLYWIATIPVKSVLDGKHPKLNIYIRPNDVISVVQAEMVYVVGSVVKSGGYLLGDKPTMTALQAISLAGGLDRSASPQHARVLRQTTEAASRQEIPINVKDLMSGKGTDFELQPKDILFIPNSMTKNIALRSLEASIQIGTGLAIYRP
jgi:polysaccharide biosynthesis/export protein